MSELQFYERINEKMTKNGCKMAKIIVESDFLRIRLYVQCMSLFQFLIQQNLKL